MNLCAVKDILILKAISNIDHLYTGLFYVSIRVIFFKKKYMLLRHLWTYELCKLTLDFDWSVTAGGPWWHIQFPVLTVWSQHNLWRLLQRSGGAVGHLCSCWPPQTATWRQQEQEIQCPGRWWIGYKMMSVFIVVLRSGRFYRHIYVVAKEKYLYLLLHTG